VEAHQGPQWALIIAGGDPIPASVRDRIGSPDWIIAADSGLDHARAIGITPDLVIGDMDSVDPASLAAAVQSGVVVTRFPTAKDATDLELAVDAVAARGMRRATIIGGAGGRLAHTLANAHLLVHRTDVRLEWLTPTARAVPIHRGERTEFAATEGRSLSILAMESPSRCRSDGLRWPLDHLVLTVGTSIGISNELVAATAQVEVMEGIVIAVQERTLDA
jgi:thiamine pyrophosphokinase